MQNLNSKIEIARRVPQQTFLCRALRGKKGFAQVQGGGIYF